MSVNIPGSFAKNSRKCPQKIQRILKNILGHIVKHPVENIKALRWMNTTVLDTGDYELYLFVWKPFLLSSTFKQLDYLFHWEIQNFGSCFKKEVNRERNRVKKSKPMFLNKKQETFEIFDLNLCMIFFFYFSFMALNPLFL